jgi:hypothetical protein
MTNSIGDNEKEKRLIADGHHLATDIFGGLVHFAFFSFGHT